MSSKRRSSILKPSKTRNPFSDLMITDGNKNDKSKSETKRRVSFANNNSVKPFTTDLEKNTIWDSTYEESIEKLQSSDPTNQKEVKQNEQYNKEIVIHELEGVQNSFLVQCENTTELYMAPTIPPPMSNNSIFKNYTHQNTLSTNSNYLRRSNSETNMFQSNSKTLLTNEIKTLNAFHTVPSYKDNIPFLFNLKSSAKHQINDENKRPVLIPELVSKLEHLSQRVIPEDKENILIPPGDIDIVNTNFDIDKENSYKFYVNKKTRNKITSFTTNTFTKNDHTVLESVDMELTKVVCGKSPCKNSNCIPDNDSNMELTDTGINPQILDEYLVNKSLKKHVRNPEHTINNFSTMEMTEPLSVLIHSCNKQTNKTIMDDRTLNFDVDMLSKTKTLPICINNQRASKQDPQKSSKTVYFTSMEITETHPVYFYDDNETKSVGVENNLQNEMKITSPTSFNDDTNRTMKKSSHNYSTSMEITNVLPAVIRAAESFTKKRDIQDSINENLIKSIDCTNKSVKSSSNLTKNSCNIHEIEDSEMKISVCPIETNNSNVLQTDDNICYENQNSNYVPPNKKHRTHDNVNNDNRVLCNSMKHFKNDISLENSPVKHRNCTFPTVHSDKIELTVENVRLNTNDLLRKKSDVVEIEKNREFIENVQMNSDDLTINQSISSRVQIQEKVMMNSIDNFQLNADDLIRKKSVNSEVQIEEKVMKSTKKLQLNSDDFIRKESIVPEVEIEEKVMDSTKNFPLNSDDLIRKKSIVPEVQIVEEKVSDLTKKCQLNSDDLIRTNKSIASEVQIVEEKVMDSTKNIPLNFDDLIRRNKSIASDVQTEEKVMDSTKNIPLNSDDLIRRNKSIASEVQTEEKVMDSTKKCQLNSDDLIRNKSIASEVQIVEEKILDSTKNVSLNSDDLIRMKSLPSGIRIEKTLKATGNEAVGTNVEKNLMELTENVQLNSDNLTNNKSISSGIKIQENVMDSTDDLINKKTITSGIEIKMENFTESIRSGVEKIMNSFETVQLNCDDLTKNQSISCGLKNQKKVQESINNSRKNESISSEVNIEKINGSTENFQMTFPKSIYSEESGIDQMESFSNSNNDYEKNKSPTDETRSSQLSDNLTNVDDITVSLVESLEDTELLSNNEIFEEENEGNAENVETNSDLMIINKNVTLNEKLSKVLQDLEEIENFSLSTQLSFTSDIRIIKSRVRQKKKSVRQINKTIEQMILEKRHSKDTIWNAALYKNKWYFGFFFNTFKLIIHLENTCSDNQCKKIEKFEFLIDETDNLSVIEQYIQYLLNQRIPVYKNALTFHYKTTENIFNLLDYVSNEINDLTNLMKNLNSLRRFGVTFEREDPKWIVSFFVSSLSLKLVVHLKINFTNLLCLHKNDIVITDILKNNSTHIRYIENLAENIEKNSTWLFYYIETIFSYMSKLEK